MKHVPTWLKTCALAIALPLASLPQTLTAEGEISMQDQAILTAIEAMTSAFEAGNLDRVMQSYEPEAAIAFEPHANRFPCGVGRHPVQKTHPVARVMCTDDTDQSGPSWDGVGGG